jgi:hypothetical protein
MDEHDDENCHDDMNYDGDPDEQRCWRCHGQGWGIVGCDWDSDDPDDESSDGEIEECDCCGGSGLAEDCEYW